ncbi:hypothetical protein D3C83_308790 [compost metagenome]
MRFGGLDLVVILLYQPEQLAIDFALEVLLGHLFIKLGALERLHGALHAVGEDEL